MELLSSLSKFLSCCNLNQEWVEEEEEVILVRVLLVWMWFVREFVWMNETTKKVIQKNDRYIYETNCYSVCNDKSSQTAGKI